MDKVVHFEVPFDDGERATAFYREAFGWELNSMPQFQYVMVTTTPTDESGRPVESGGITTYGGTGGAVHPAIAAGDLWAATAAAGCAVAVAAHKSAGPKGDRPG